MTVPQYVGLRTQKMETEAMIYPHNDYDSSQRLTGLYQSGIIPTCTFDCLMPRNDALAMSQGLNQSAKRAGRTSAARAMYVNYYTVNVDGPPGRN